MNKYVIIGLIVLLAIVLFLLVRIFRPSVRKTMERLPGWVTFLLILLVLLIIALLIRSLIKSGGMPGASGEKEVSGVEQQHTVTPESDIDNCIIIRADRILINGADTDLQNVDAYLNTKAAEGVQITVVDDFSLASLYRAVIDMCEKKGVNYNTQDEKWLEEQ